MADAATLENSIDASSQAPPAPLAFQTNRVKQISAGDQEQEKGAPEAARSDPAAPALVVKEVSLQFRPQGEPVMLHIYEAPEGAIPWLRSLVQPGAVAPHIAVEVFGQEWSLNQDDSGVVGIRSCPPRCSPGHTYTESVVMGGTPLSRVQMRELLDSVGAERELSNSRFIDAVCRGLGVGSPPEWVTNLDGANTTVVDQAVAQVHAAAGSVQAFMMTTHEVDTGIVGATAQDLWLRASQQLAPIGAFVESMVAEEPVKPLPASSACASPAKVVDAEPTATGAGDPSLASPAALTEAPVSIAPLASQRQPASNAEPVPAWHPAVAGCEAAQPLDKTLCLEEASGSRSLGNPKATEGLAADADDPFAYLEQRKKEIQAICAAKEQELAMQRLTLHVQQRAADIEAIATGSHRSGTEVA